MRSLCDNCQRVCCQVNCTLRRTRRQDNNNNNTKLTQNWVRKCYKTTQQISSEKNYSTFENRLESSEALTKWLQKCPHGARVYIVIAIRATNQLVSHMSQPSTENCSTLGHLQNGNSRQYLHFLLSYIPRREELRPTGGQTCLFTHIYVYMLAMYKQEAISFDMSPSIVIIIVIIIFFRQSVNRLANVNFSWVRRNWK